MRVVGGLEIGGSNKREIGAFVTEISPGGVVDTHGEVEEGTEQCLAFLDDYYLHGLVLNLHFSSDRAQ